jgi:hypothetical protein
MATVVRIWSVSVTPRRESFDGGYDTLDFEGLHQPRCEELLDLYFWGVFLFMVGAVGWLTAACLAIVHPEGIPIVVFGTDLDLGNFISMLSAVLDLLDSLVYCCAWYFYEAKVPDPNAFAFTTPARQQSISAIISPPTATALPTIAEDRLHANDREAGNSFPTRTPPSTPLVGGRGIPRAPQWRCWCHGMAGCAMNTLTTCGDWHWWYALASVYFAWNTGPGTRGYVPAPG